MATMIRRVVLSLVFALTLLSGTAIAGGILQCTDYVASLIGIWAYGDGWKWWNDTQFTNTGYTKSSTPSVGSIIVFDKWDFGVDSNGIAHKNPHGHVGIVRQIVSSSEIRIDHANWHLDGKIFTDVAVKQAAGSWSQVKVKYNPGDASYGATAVPVLGFLIPPLSTYSVIGIANPYFFNSCIRDSPPDSRCVTFDVSLWWQCWGHPYLTASPYCVFGLGGGEYTTSLPDLVMYRVWLEDANGQRRTVFHPGEQITMKGQVKNTGDGNPSVAITMKFYRSNGENVDSNKQEVGDGTIQASNLTTGSTHTETEVTSAPTALGTYNITACADTGNVVAEEKKSNNCSGEVVFTVARRTPEERKKFLRNIMQIINN